MHITKMSFLQQIVVMLIVIIGGVFLGGQSDAFGSDKLKIWYINYPPYYLNQDGKATGILVDQVNEIMERAGIEVDYTCFPAKRILYALKRDIKVATIGWFKTEEREKYAKFSLPIYTNKPVQIFALKSVALKIQEFKTLKSLLGSGDFKIGLVDGHSEGEYIDKIIQKYPAQVHWITGCQVQLIKMLSVGRFDFLLLPPEEVAMLVDEAGADPKSFSLLPMNDIPSGNKRYIMYSRSVSQEIIDRVNSAIVDLCH